MNSINAHIHATHTHRLFSVSVFSDTVTLHAQSYSKDLNHDGFTWF